MDSIAASLGVEVTGLKLLLSILAAIPAALAWRRVPTSGPARHVFSIVFAVAAIAWCYGAFWHSFICILFTWLLMQVLGNNRKLAAIINFVFQMVYVLVGYWVLHDSENHAVDWTMPHCVLCLRLIGLTMDFWDGSRSEAELKASLLSSKDALPQAPGLLETFGFAYWFGGFHIGPQFTMVTYRRIVKDDASDQPSPMVPFLRALGLGVFYLLFNLVGVGYFPLKYTITDEFAAKSFLWKVLYMAGSGKVALAQYIAVWKFAEAGCVLSGASYYEGKNWEGKDGQHWDLMQNVRVAQWEFAPKASDGMVAGFNIHTNAWVKRCIMKRLVWVGSKNISFISALFFLAAWHGYAFGYYVTFGTEFLWLLGEAHYVGWFSFLDSMPGVKWVLSRTLGNLWKYCILGFAAHPFVLLSIPATMKVMNAVYWWLPILSIAMYSVVVLTSKKKNKKPKTS